MATVGRQNTEDKGNNDYHNKGGKQLTWHVCYRANFDIKYKVMWYY